MIEDNCKILLENVRLKTRIDLVSGSCGAGKTRLIDHMLSLGNYPFGQAEACQGYKNWRETVLTARRIVYERRPARLLLETPGGMLPEDVPAALGSILRHSYIGTCVIVINGNDFLRQYVLMKDYFDRLLRQACVAFVNRTEAQDTKETLEMLQVIWAVNQHINLMIEPLSGIDLWRVFDLCVK